MASEKVVLELTTRMKDETRAALRKMRSGIDRFKRHAITAFASIGRALKRMARIMSTALKVGLVAGGAALFGGGKLIANLIGTASEAEEIGSKFDTVFKEMAKGVREWAGETAAALNTSRFDLEKYLSSMQDLLFPMGFARDAAAEMSKQVVKLAVDLSSFNNIPVEDALLAIRSALIGESEPIRQFGVMLNEASKEAEILRAGLSGLAETAPIQAKAMATLNLIMAGTTDAQGDAARTAGMFANSWRGLSAAIRDMKVSLGNVILPLATGIVKTFKNWINQLSESGKAQLWMAQLAERFSKAWKWFKGFVVNGGLAKVLGTIKTEFNKLWTDVLQPQWEKLFGTDEDKPGIFSGMATSIAAMKDNMTLFLEEAQRGFTGIGEVGGAVIDLLTAKFDLMFARVAIGATKINQFTGLQGLVAEKEFIRETEARTGKRPSPKAIREWRKEAKAALNAEHESILKHYGEAIPNLEATIARSNATFDKYGGTAFLAERARKQGEGAFGGAGGGASGFPMTQIFNEEPARRERDRARRNALRGQRAFGGGGSSSQGTEVFAPPPNIFEEVMRTFAPPVPKTTTGAPVKGISVIIEGIAPQPRDQIAAGRRPAPYLVT